MYPGLPPLATNVCEYARPTSPLLSEAVAIARGPLTVTLAVVSAIKGRALAWITVEPNPIPVTGTLMLLELAGMVTVAGTVATLVLVELKLTVSPPAGA